MVSILKLTMEFSTSLTKEDSVDLKKISFKICTTESKL